MVALCKSYTCIYLHSLQFRLPPKTFSMFKNKNPCYFCCSLTENKRVFLIVSWDLFFIHPFTFTISTFIFFYFFIFYIYLFLLVITFGTIAVTTFTVTLLLYSWMHNHLTLDCCTWCSLAVCFFTDKFGGAHKCRFCLFC